MRARRCGIAQSSILSARRKGSTSTSNRQQIRNPQSAIRNRATPSSILPARRPMSSRDSVSGGTRSATARRLPMARRARTCDCSARRRIPTARSCCTRAGIARGRPKVGAPGRSVIAWRRGPLVSCGRFSSAIAASSIALRTRRPDAVIRYRLTRHRWTIGVIPIGVEDIIQRGTLPEPTWLAGQPSDRFYADPFPIAVCGDRMRVLVEEYIYPSRVKRLAEIEIGCAGDFLRRTGDGTLPRPASYPFLLRRDGRLFCMPETSGARRVSSFVSDDGGRSWMHHRDLLTGFPFVDATLVEHDGTWWMFCTKQGDEDQTELHVFFATDWCGPWQPHPLNPVKSDTRSSRPAGACLRIDGVLSPPAKTCAP